MNSKSILRPLFQTAVALCLMAQPLSALTSGNFTYVDYGTYVSITDYPTTATGAVIIPATIAGKPVTSIGQDAFNGCLLLTSVTIPSSVTIIGGSAFYSCRSLTSVKIPNSVTYIGTYAFSHCSGLTSVTIPVGVTSIGYNAFEYCSGLTSVTIPASVTSIGLAAFRDCSGLTRVTIPSSVTSIGYATFQNCSGLTSVTIPSSVTSIGDYAFLTCSGLTRANFLGNAPLMGSYIFNATPPDFTIYYQNGKTGFTSPTWNGYPCVGIDPPPTPEIVVQYPAGTSLVDGTSKKSYGTVVVGQSSAAKTFTIKNTGTANLSGLAVSKNGANSGNFLITQPAKTTLLPGGSTTFKVTFTPNATGIRTAAIHIKSNDADENPFDIQLTGLGAVP